MTNSSDHQLAERRRFPRFPCTGAAEIHQIGQCRRLGKVSDISRGGCYIETLHPLPVGTESQLRLTVGDILLDVDAKVSTATPSVGMGMEFMAVPQAQENKLVQIIEKITAINSSPAVLQAKHLQPSSAPVRITREAAPGILARIIKTINERDVLTRRELIEIVNTIG